MADGSGLVLTNKDVWNVYSPNPPRIQWITMDKIAIRTKKILASDAAEQFRYIGLDMFIGYGRYTNSIYLPYDSISVLGYWNVDMTKDLRDYAPGSDIEFIIDFRKWKNTDGWRKVCDFRNEPIRNPSGIPGITPGAEMTFADLYKIFKCSGAIYFRVFHRTTWACFDQTAKFTDVGYIYSGYVDNFTHPTVGHTFENGICVYPYKPLVYVLYDKANTNMSIQIAVPWTFRQHTGSSFSAVNDYVPSNGSTEFDIAITASVVGDPDVEPGTGMSATYGPGEHEIYRYKFTKNTNDRFSYYNYNKNIAEVFPQSKRGKNIAFRVWYNYNQNGGGWSGWETTGPDPDRNFNQCYLAEQKCFPTMYYNRLPQFRLTEVFGANKIRNNTIADEYNVRYECWDDDNDMFDYVSDIYACKPDGSTLSYSWGYNSKSMSAGRYDFTKSNSIQNIINLLKSSTPSLTDYSFYGTHFEIPSSTADRFDAYNSNGTFTETITSPRQSGNLKSPYTIDFRPTNLSVTFDHTVGEAFIATIHGNHPDWANCKFYFTAKDEDNRWEQAIRGTWGDGTWQHYVNSWQTGNVISFNLLSMFGEAYRGKRFKFYVAAISKNGWDTHLGWTELMVRLNDKPTVSMNLTKTLGPIAMAQIHASDQDGVGQIKVDLCLDSNGNADTSKLWTLTYNITGEAYVNISEDITAKLKSFGITPYDYVGKKVFLRAGATDRLGCQRATSEMGWQSMVYDTPPDISFYLENTKGEEAFMILETTYPNGLPRLTITAECPNGVDKFVYNNYEVTEHLKRIRIRFAPYEYLFTDADRMKQFKFRVELTNSMGQSMTYRTEFWTWNDIPRVSIESVSYEPLNNGLIRKGASTLYPTINVNMSDTDNITIKGQIGNDNSNDNLKTVITSDSNPAGTRTKAYNIDLKQFFKTPGSEFNFKSFRVTATDIFNKVSGQAISQRFRMLDGHRIEAVNIEPASYSTTVNNDISGKNFNVRIKFRDVPYAKIVNGEKSVVDLQLYRRNTNKYRILYIKVTSGISPYYEYIKNSCTVSLMDKQNERNYISTLTYENLHPNYDLLIIDACYVSLYRNELEKAKELADRGFPCYVIGNDTQENVFGNGVTTANAGADVKWRSGVVNTELPFTNTIENVSLSSDTKNFYNNLNASVFPIVTSNGKYAIFCYTSPVDGGAVPYSKASYVIQDNDYALEQSMFIRLVNFLVDTKKDFHTLISHQTYDLTSFDSNYTCKPSDIVKTFDGSSLSLGSNQKVFAKARVRTLVNSGWSGDYFYYFEDSNKNFVYAPEPDKPVAIFPVTSSNLPICLKNPPIGIFTSNQSNPANSQISDIRVKWNGQYYYASTQTQNFSNTVDNYNNMNIVFYPPSLLSAGLNRIEINVKAKLTNVWSPTTILDIYVKDVNVVKTQGNIATAYIEPRTYINELRRAYRMSDYSFPSVSQGVPITFENHVNVLNKAFNEMVDKINGYCVRKTWCTPMNIGNQIFILASSTTTINNFLTKFNK